MCGEETAMSKVVDARGNPMHVRKPKRNRKEAKPQARVRKGVEKVVAWLEAVEKFDRRIVEEQGHLPDSTLEIAADRGR